MMELKVVTVIAIAIITVARPNVAEALGPLDAEVAVKGGGGTRSGDSSLDLVLGNGIGARAGVSFLGGVYTGLNFMRYFGRGTAYGYSQYYVLYGVEAGYGFSLRDDHLIFRPQLGVGNAVLSSSPRDQRQSTDNLYLEPGITLLFVYCKMFVGGDVNVLTSVRRTYGEETNDRIDILFTAHAQVGMKF